MAKAAAKSPVKKKVAKKASPLEKTAVKKSAAKKTAVKKKVDDAEKTSVRKSKPASSKTPAKAPRTTVTEKARVAPVSLDGASVIPSLRRKRSSAIPIVLGTDSRRPYAWSRGTECPYPFRMICQLIITFPRGERQVGTGWFGGPSTLFTAGHCVYDKSLGGRATSITVWWPLNGSKHIATDWNCTPEWQKTESEIYDFGCVHLPVKSEDWFSYGDYKDPQFAGKPVHVFGYPNDKMQQQPNPSLIGEVGYLDRAEKSQLYYKVDTGSGQSGAPVFIWDSTSSHALSVGIHNYGGVRQAINYATRITADIVSRLNAWWK